MSVSAYYFIWPMYKCTFCKLYCEVFTNKICKFLHVHIIKSYKNGRIWICIASMYRIYHINSSIYQLITIIIDHQWWKNVLSLFAINNLQFTIWIRASEKGSSKFIRLDIYLTFFSLFIYTLVSYGMYKWCMP